MAVTVGILLFWNEIVIVIVFSKLGDEKVQSVSVLKSTRPARGAQHLLQSQKVVCAMGTALDTALL